MDALRKALLSLKATGETGFEGLVSTTLSAIVGAPFRLASSGSQYGVDGDAASQAEAISFEAKRYKGPVKRESVMAKLAELSLGPETDVFVLAATTSVGTQLVRDARRIAADNGIAIVVLDWGTNDLPALAVALAMAGDPVEAFLGDQLAEPKSRRAAISCLSQIRERESFSADANRIRTECCEHPIAVPLARLANGEWFIHTFSSRKSARHEFGQPISLAESDTHPVLERTALVENLRSRLAADSRVTVIPVLGGEGHGKSWLVAQA